MNQPLDKENTIPSVRNANVDTGNGKVRIRRTRPIGTLKAVVQPFHGDTDAQDQQQEGQKDSSHTPVKVKSREEMVQEWKQQKSKMLTPSKQPTGRDSSALKSPLSTRSLKSHVKDRKKLNEWKRRTERRNVAENANNKIRTSRFGIVRQRLQTLADDINRLSQDESLPLLQCIQHVQRNQVELARQLLTNLYDQRDQDMLQSSMFWCVRCAVEELNDAADDTIMAMFDEAMVQYESKPRFAIEQDYREFLLHRLHTLETVAHVPSTPKRDGHQQPRRRKSVGVDVLNEMLFETPRKLPPKTPTRSTSKRITSSQEDDTDNFDGCIDTPINHIPNPAFSTPRRHTIFASPMHKTMIRANSKSGNENYVIQLMAVPAPEDLKQRYGTDTVVSPMRVKSQGQKRQEQEDINKLLQESNYVYAPSCSNLLNLSDEYDTDDEENDDTWEPVEVEESSWDEFDDDDDDDEIMSDGDESIDFNAQDS